jgi:hypothetical protein
MEATLVVGRISTVIIIFKNKNKKNNMIILAYLNRKLKTLSEYVLITILSYNLKEILNKKT